jgi:DNA segregation ATPase FtsK/SpoIIIE-like protein
VVLPWEALGHILVAGMSGSGKSVFLRSLVYQALHTDCHLALFDAQSRTFDYLDGHPALLAPRARTLDQAGGLLEAVQTELARREGLYRQASGYPDNLDEYNAVADAPNSGLPHLRRLLVVLDEYNTLVARLGGAKAPFAQAVNDLIAVARKWGITLVFAGQLFHRDTSGFVREQCKTRICFQVEDRFTAELAAGSAAPLALRVPGRAILRGLGTVQTYLVAKDVLIAKSVKLDGRPMPTTEDVALGERILREFGGAFNIENLRLIGVGTREAHRKVGDWKRNGWAAHRPKQANAVYLTEDFIVTHLAAMVNETTDAPRVNSSGLVLEAVA